MLFKYFVHLYLTSQIDPSSIDDGLHQPGFFQQTSLKEEENSFRLILI